MDLVRKKYIHLSLLYIYTYIYILFIKQCPLKFMSGNIWWLTKVGGKLQFDLVIFSIFSTDNPLYFHKSIHVLPLKYLMHLLAGINTK